MFHCHGLWCHCNVTDPCLKHKSSQHTAPLQPEPCTGTRTNLPSEQGQGEVLGQGMDSGRGHRNSGTVSTVAGEGALTVDQQPHRASLNKYLWKKKESWKGKCWKRKYRCVSGVSSNSKDSPELSRDSPALHRGSCSCTNQLLSRPA